MHNDAENQAYDSSQATSETQSSRRILGPNKLWLLLLVVFAVAGSVVANAFYRQQYAGIAQRVHYIAAHDSPMAAEPYPTSQNTLIRENRRVIEEVAQVQSAELNNQLNLEERSLEIRVQQLSVQLRQVATLNGSQLGSQLGTRPNGIQMGSQPGADTNRMQAELKKILTQIFELRHRQQSVEIARLEKELAATKALHQKRSERREEIVDRRFNQLLGNSDDLNWDTGSSSAQSIFDNRNSATGNPGAVYYPVDMPSSQLTVPQSIGVNQRADIDRMTLSPTLDSNTNQSMLPDMPIEQPIPIYDTPQAAPMSQELPQSATQEPNLSPRPTRNSSPTSNRSLIEAGYAYKEALLAFPKAKVGDVEAVERVNRFRAIWNAEKMQAQFNYEKCKLLTDSLAAQFEQAKSLHERGITTLGEFSRKQLDFQLAEVEFTQSKIGIESSDSLSKEIEAIEAKIKKLSPQATISGQITLKGSPLSGVRVILLDEKNDTHETTTGDDGAFRIQIDSNTKYRVTLKDTKEPKNLPARFSDQELSVLSISDQAKYWTLEVESDNNFKPQNEREGWTY